MRAGTFIVSLLLLFTTACAQPRLHRHHHHKRQVAMDYVIVEIPEVVAWLDRAGNTISLETKGPVVTRTQSEPPTGDPALNDPSPPALKVKSTDVASVNNDVLGPEEPVTAGDSGPEVRTKLVLSPVPSAAESAVDTATPASATPSYVGNSGEQSQDSTQDGGIGICYSAYADDGSCKTQPQVDDEFSRLTNYTLIRSYGVDCDQVKHMASAAKTHNKKLFVGIFDLHNLQHELQTLTESVGSSWDLITAVSIGNELVNSGKATPKDVVDAVNSARPTLRDAGFTGPVVTVDTFNAIIAHPELCNASDDFCAANCHAFFDPNTGAEEAGSFVKKQAERVSDAAGGKRTVITESGWPHNGVQNGEATPSDPNQQVALTSLREAFAGTDGALYLFSAFDQGWKEDTSRTFGTERYWGIM